MTKQEWFSYANANRDKLIQLVTAYHPAVARDFKLQRYAISNKRSQEACNFVSREIKRATPINHDVIQGFITALNNEDYPLANRILNETWFGVPETKHCMRIIGFPESLKLMDESVDEFVVSY